MKRAMDSGKMKRGFQRRLSVLLCGAMLLMLLLPISALAEGSDPEQPINSSDSEPIQTDPDLTGAEDGQDEERVIIAADDEPQETVIIVTDGEPEATRNTVDEDGSEPSENNEAAVMAVSALPAALADVDPDANYILVGKTFVGITPDRIPENFAITVQPQSGGTPHVLTKSGASISEDGLTWKWRIDNVGTGTYTVSESGQDINGYALTTSGVGTVEVKAAQFETTHDKETTCSHTNWPVSITGDTNVMFAAALTGNKGCVVISKNQLTASQRANVEAAVIGIGGNWKTPVYFYSIDVNGNGPWTIQGRELYYDPNTQEVILHDTKDWTHVANVYYSILEASNPDIGIVNTYSRLSVPVSIQKTVAGNMGDRAREFSFTVSCTEPIGPSADGSYTLSDDGKTASFTLTHGAGITLSEVFYGAALTVSESNAADYVTRVSVGDTTLTGENGSYSYVIPHNAEAPIVISVVNTKDITIDTGIALDRLPYVVILLLVGAGAAWLIIRNRRRYNED